MSFYDDPYDDPYADDPYEDPYQDDEEEEEPDPFDMSTDSEPDAYTDTLANIATSAPTPPVQQVQPQAQAPAVQRPFFPTQAPATPAPQAPVVPQRPVTPPPPDDWSDVLRPSTPSGTGSAAFIEGLRAKGLWGDKYGAAVGRGDVQVGGGIVAPTPSYITGVETTTTPGRPGTTTTTAAPGRASSAPSGPPQADIQLPNKLDTSSRKANLQQWAPALARVEQETGLSAVAIGAIIIAENGGGETPLSRNQNNYFSIAKHDSPRQIGSQAMASDNPTMGVYANPQDSLDDFVELVSTSPRYAKAWAVRGDPKRFHEELAAAGYVENGNGREQHWLKLLDSTRDQYVDIAGSVNPAPPVSAQARDNYAEVPGDVAGAAVQSIKSLRGVTPSQADYAENVDKADGWAMCSLFAASGQLGAFGIKVDPASMKDVAAKYGWTSADGQRGPEAHVKMFNELAQTNGSDARAAYEDGIDWKKVQQNVAEGRPVVLNAWTTPAVTGHYYVVEDYDASTGRYYLGNSLMSLRVGKPTGGWVTPDELNALQSQTSINMKPNGAIYTTGGTPNGAVGHAPAPSPSATAPSAASTTRTTPGTAASSNVSFTATPGAPGSVPDQAIRHNLGRPLTLTDIAMGTWNGPAAPVAPPPQIQYTTKTAPAPAAGPAALPDWRQQRIAEANAPKPVAPAPTKPAGPPPELEGIDPEALQREHEAAAAYQAQQQAYITEAKEVAKKNLDLERDYQERYTAGLITGSGTATAPRTTYGEGGDEGPTQVAAAAEAGEDRPAFYEYPEPPKAPPTPNLDKMTAVANKKKRDEWVAAGSDPNTEPKAYNVTSDLETAARDFQQGSRDNEQRIANEYGALVGEQRDALLARIQAEQERRAGVARAATFAPPNEYARMIEANQSNSTATVSVEMPAVRTPVIEDTQAAVDAREGQLAPISEPAKTAVYSRPEDIDTLPEPTDDQINAVLYDVVNGKERSLPGLSDVENAERILAGRGLYSADEKAKLKAKLSENLSINRANEIETEQQIRATVPITMALPSGGYVNSVKEIDALPEKPQAMIELPDGTSRPFTKEDEAAHPEFGRSWSPAEKAKLRAEFERREQDAGKGFYTVAPTGPLLTIPMPGGGSLNIANPLVRTEADARAQELLRAGFRDVQSTTGAGIMGLGSVLKVPDLQVWGSEIYNKANQANRIEAIDPKSMSLVDKTYRAAPSMLAGIAVSMPVALALGAVGAPAAVIAGVGLGISAASTFIQEGGDAYADAKKSGAPDEVATSAFLIKGSANAAIENLPIGKILSKAPGGEAVKDMIVNKIMSGAVPHLAAKLASTAVGRLAMSKGANITGDVIKDFLAEGGQEWVQEAVGIATEQMYKDSSFMQLLDERGIESFTVGGALGAATSATTSVAGEVAPDSAAWRALYASTLGERSGSQPSSTGHVIAALQPNQQPGPSSPLNFPFQQAVPNLNADSSLVVPRQGQQAVEEEEADPLAEPTTPAAPTGPRVLQGTDQPLLETKYDNDGYLTHDENNLVTEAVPDWDATVAQHTTESEAIQTNTATPAQRMQEAVTNIAKMEAATGGLNADQRAALLEKYGFGLTQDTSGIELGQDARTIAAQAAFHIAQHPEDAPIVTKVLQGQFGVKAGSKTPETFQKRVNAALASRVAPRPVAAPQAAPSIASVPAQVAAQGAPSAAQGGIYSVPSGYPQVPHAPVDTNAPPEYQAHQQMAAAATPDALGALLAHSLQSNNPDMAKAIQAEMAARQEAAAPGSISQGAAAEIGPAELAQNVPEQSVRQARNNLAKFQNEMRKKYGDEWSAQTTPEELQRLVGLAQTAAQARSNNEPLQVSPSGRIGVGQNVRMGPNGSLTASAPAPRAPQAPAASRAPSSPTRQPGGPFIDPNPTMMLDKDGNNLLAPPSRTQDAASSLANIPDDFDPGFGLPGTYGTSTPNTPSRGGNRPTAAPGASSSGGTTQTPTSSSSAPEIVDSSATVGTRGKGGLKGRVVAALPEGDADTFNEILADARRNSPTKTLTAGDVVETLEGMYGDTPDVLKGIVDKAGLGGVRDANGNVRPIGQAPAPKTPTAPRKGRGKAPAAPAAQQEKNPLRQVWVITPVGQELAQGESVGNGDERLEVFTDPSMAGIGQEFFDLNPVMVRESDLVTEDGNTYIKTPGGSMVPERAGALGRDYQGTLDAEKASEVIQDRRMDNAESSAKLDHTARVAVPGGSHMTFQRDELSDAERKDIAESEAMVKTAEATQTLFDTLKQQMSDRFGDMPNKIRFGGPAWMPHILGITRGRATASNPNVTASATIFTSPHAMYNQALRWASRVGISPNSDMFRRHLAGLHVGTMIHEMAHTRPVDETMDEGGHGGSHSESIRAILDELDVDSMVADMYTALTPEVLAETQQQLGTLEESVGNPVQEEAAAPVSETPQATASSEPEAEATPVSGPSDTSGMNIIDADSRSLYSRENGRMIQRMQNALATVLSRIQVEQNNADPKKAQSLGVRKGRELASKILNKGTTVKSYWDILRAEHGPEIEDAVAQRLKIDGLTYTDSDGSTQTRVFPHAQGATNAADTTNRSRDARTDLGTDRRGDEIGESGGTDGFDRSFARAQRLESPGSLRNGSGGTSRGTNVGGSTRSNGRNTGDYAPGTNVRRANDGSVARKTRPPTGTVLGRNDFWSPSRGIVIKGASAAERSMFQRIENAMHEADPELSPHGKVVEWRSEEDWNGRPLAFMYSDRGKTRGVRPDILVAYADGHQEILEVKRMDAPQEEDTFFRSEAAKERGIGKARHGWHVKAKAIAMISASSFVNETKPVTYRIIGSLDPLITGRPVTPAFKPYYDFYNRVNEAAARIPNDPEVQAIADPVERYKAIARQARQAVINADQETYASTEGSTRAAPTMAFVAAPTFEGNTQQEVRRLGDMAPGATDILEDNQQYGLSIDGVRMGANPFTGDTTAVIEVTGDIDAAEKQAAELAQAAGTASDPRTYVFHEDSRGNAFVHSVDIQADDSLSSALANYANPDGPTLTTIHSPDGQVERVILSSRTPSGERLSEDDFMEARDNLTDVLQQLGIEPENIYTAKGNITHFDDPREGGVDNAIARRTEILGQAPLGRSVPPPAATAAETPIGNPRGRAARQYEPPTTGEVAGSDSIPDFGGIRDRNDSITDLIRRNPDISRAELKSLDLDISANGLKALKGIVRQEQRAAENMQPAAFNPAPFMAQPEVGQSDEEQELGDTVREFTRQQNPPGAPTPAGRLPQVPGLDLTKFSREARAPIRAAAIAIQAAGGPPANTRQAAILHLGTNARDFANSRASSLSDIELAAVVQNLNVARANIDNTAKTLANPANPAPTNDQLRDFVMEGIRYQAMHQQLKGDPEQVRQGSREFTKARRNTQKGETVQMHLERILNYARTSDKNGKDFTREFIAQFHNGNMLGATSYQMGQAWDQVLNPKTTFSDWALAVMYNALLGPATAAIAMTFNIAEIQWRLLRDMGSAAANVGLNTVTLGRQGYGLIEATSMLGAEAQGYAFGIIRAFNAAGQTLWHGATRANITMGDVPYDRLQHNNMGIFSTVADKIGAATETFFGRFFSAADAFAKMWAYSMELGRQSAIASKAQNNGQVSLQIANNLFNNPTEEMMEKAQRVGLESVFQGKMGALGENLAWMQNYPAIGRMIFPFLRTIYHGLARTVDRSPVGAVTTIADIIRTTPGRNFLQQIANAPSQSAYLHNQPNKLNAVRPVAERFQDAVMGTAAYTMLWGFLQQGLIDLTGEPPDDEKERDQWQREHKTPYSIRFGENGQYYSFANWGVPAPGLALLAEINRAKKSGKEIDANMVTAVVGNFGKALITMSFISTLAEVMEASAGRNRDDANALSTPLGRYAESLITSRMPLLGAFTMRMGQVQDPYVRYPDAKESIAKRLAQDISVRLPAYIPFTETLIGRLGGEVGGQKLGRDTVNPVLDIWGFPVVNPFYDAPSDKPGALGTAINVASGIGQVFNPFRGGGERTSDLVDQEIRRMQEAGVDKRPTRAPNEYEGHKFTEDEMWEWKRRVGQGSYARLAHLFQHPAYQSAPMEGEGSKDRMIDAQYESAKKDAWDSLGIVDPGAEPKRDPKFLGIKEEAAKRGIPWWQFEKEVEKTISKWNDWRDAAKTGRQRPAMTPEEIRTAAQYSRSHDRLETLENQRARTEVKKVDDGYAPIPFTALPGIP